jgi:hypothetical protein
VNVLRKRRTYFARDDRKERMTEVKDEVKESKKGGGSSAE